MSNYKTVFFTLGVLQIILGVSMVIPIIIQVIYNQLDSSFIGAGIITIIFGVLFFLSNLNHDRKLNLQQAFLLTSLSWISIAIFGSLPFIFSSLELSITDAIFESMSGITTTGSTIITNLNDSPKAILFWRAILQWLGGIGIIVMAITLMPIMNVGGMQLFKISTSDKSEKILPKSKEISIRLILIYSGLTFLCAIFYKTFGMNFFDSLTHSMTTIATGGFSNYNESIGYFNSPTIEITSIIFIILGSIPFIAYIKFLSGDKKIFISDSQIKSFAKIIIISILILFFYLVLQNKNFEELDGKSLLNAMKGGKYEEHYVFTETGNPLNKRAPPKQPNTKSIRSSNWKLIFNEYNDTKELYNIQLDISKSGIMEKGFKQINWILAQ